jgi:hypothetical protein
MSWEKFAQSPNDNKGQLLSWAKVVYEREGPCVLTKEGNAWKVRNKSGQVLAKGTSRRAALRAAARVK